MHIRPCAGLIGILFLEKIKLSLKPFSKAMTGNYETL